MSGNQPGAGEQDGEEDSAADETGGVNANEFESFAGCICCIYIVKAKIETEKKFSNSLAQDFALAAKSVRT